MGNAKEEDKFLTLKFYPIDKDTKQDLQNDILSYTIFSPTVDTLGIDSVLFFDDFITFFYDFTILHETLGGSLIPIFHYDGPLTF